MGMQNGASNAPLRHVPIGAAQWRMASERHFRAAQSAQCAGAIAGVTLLAISTAIARVLARVLGFGFSAHISRVRASWSPGNATTTHARVLGFGRWRPVAPNSAKFGLGLLAGLPNRSRVLDPYTWLSESPGPRVLSSSSSGGMTTSARRSDVVAGGFVGSTIRTSPPRRGKRSMRCAQSSRQLVDRIHSVPR